MPGPTSTRWTGAADGFGVGAPDELDAGLLLVGGTLLAIVAHHDDDAPPAAPYTPWDLLTWTAPNLERMSKPRPAAVRRLALTLLRGYTLVTLALLLAHLGILLAGR